MSKDMKASLTQKESTVHAWEAIRAMQMGRDRIKEANADKLQRDFGDLQFNPWECLEDLE
jgi:hypothetical protein